MKKKKMRKRRRGKGKGLGAVRASGDRGRGRPRVASSRVCGPREMGHAARRGGRKNERGKKEGARFAAAGRDASRWMGKRWDVN